MPRLRGRARLSEMLRAEGFDVLPEEILIERGTVGRPTEITRWHAWADKGAYTYHLMSPNTVSECLKGFTLKTSGSYVMIDAAIG